MNATANTVPNFASDQEVRWCPGCGDFAILAQMKKVLPTLGVKPENTVVVSGIGCSSRFPYYLETYGMHGIHGRAPAIATGLKRTRPDLQVWVVTGDGDALSIGCTHLLHALRRNVDIKILLFNNRIYGLTKGQFSPTSLPGLVTSSTPMGTAHEPLHPLSIALASNATFVARSVDTNAKHLGEVLRRAAAHRGSAFVEIYQNCHIFNDGAFDFAKNPAIRDDHIVAIAHGEPLVFGKNRDKGIRLDVAGPEVVTLGGEYNEPDLLVHDEKADTNTIAQMIAGMRHPLMPEAIGVLRDVDRPTHNDLMRDKTPDPKSRETAVNRLLHGGETWTVA
ncbi:2-oxoacid:ferredoxin oxidoreductase subunit beta [Pelagibius sp. Alg239-R121]|uniref:2-oxoacid:ferredoxin oxidoreductase subunit beta n=1 Tax=Pelagibius sp. Alg239-R121 TaxID=2993448 RepID=UPI0024A6DA7D|nr:2-oxoacid:ferredoxin oxidoreductase subunit beta [Pelagibius sp. Alg239-R121]